MQRTPICYDLFCGLGGWAEGFLAEGYSVIGYDIEAHDYGTGGYPGELRLRDVLTIHGSEFKDATVIVASPPCQRYSYMAMPWSKAKALIRWYEEKPERVQELNALFDACFRIQREASEAAGRHIPLIVENVRGAQRWVGRAKWHYGSFYLWGDLPALMPMTFKGVKNAGTTWRANGCNAENRMTPSSVSEGYKTVGMNWSDQTKRGQDFTRIAGQQNGDGLKMRDSDGYERNHPNALGWKAPRTSSRAPARKAASAMIAKIPFPLAQHIARSFLNSERARISAGKGHLGGCPVEGECRLETGVEGRSKKCLDA